MNFMGRYYKKEWSRCTPIHKRSLTHQYVVQEKPSCGIQQAIFSIIGRKRLQQKQSWNYQKKGVEKKGVRLTTSWTQYV